MTDRERACWFVLIILWVVSVEFRLWENMRVLQVAIEQGALP